MAVRLYSEFKSDRGDQYKIEIHDTQWLAVPTEFNVDSRGFELTYEGETDDVVSPIVGSKLSFGAYSANATFETFINTLKTFQENRFKIAVYKYNGTSYDPYWFGWVLQDLVTIEDESQPYVYQMTAADGIGRLANIDYVGSNIMANGLTKVTNVIGNCIAFIDTDDLWDAGDVFLETSVDWWETSSQTYSTTKDTLDEHAIDTRVFESEDDNGATIYSRAYDVINELAITYGARFYQSNGRWVFEQYVNRAGATRYVSTYDKTITRLSTASVNDDVTIDQTTNAARLAGGQFTYLPAVGSVSVEYARDKFNSQSAPYTFRSTAPTKTLGIIGASTSTQLKFYGPHNYNITSSTGATTNDGNIAVVWRMQIRIESATTPGLYYYYNRAFNGFAANSIYGNAAWSTTAGYYYYHTPFAKVVFGELSYNPSPVITTAKLPTSGTLRITAEHYTNINPVDGTTYVLEPHQTDTWSVTFIVARLDDSRDESTSITYRAQNTNANVDSKIELSLGTTRISNGLFQTGDLSVYNGTSWVSGVSFRRGSTGSGNQILNLLVAEMVGLHSAPIRRFSGEIQNISPLLRRLIFDGGYYLNNSGSFIAQNDRWSAEWFMIAYQSGVASPLDDIRTPISVLTDGGADNDVNIDGVLEVGRVGGMVVNVDEQKMGPFQQLGSTANPTGARVNGTLNVTGDVTLDAGLDVDGVSQFNNDVNITGSVTSTGPLTGEYVQLDTTYNTTPVQGQIVWSQDDGTIDVGLNSNVVMQVGQEEFWYVKNQTGSTITKGTAVRAAGTLGASGRILAAPMIADGSVPARFLLGIAAENIVDGGEGYVTTFGKIRQLNTSAYTEGAVLWCNPAVAGGLTTTEPSAPNLKLAVAFVVRSDSTSGVLAVRSEIGARVSDASDVQVTSVADNDLLQYNTTTSRWENVAGTTTNIGEGTNLYYTDGRARAAISETIDGISYNNTTGVFSLDANRVIVTTTQTGQWDTAYNDRIVSAAVAGTTTKTLTLTQGDGGTITASWTDYDTAPVTSVNGQTGVVVLTTDNIGEGTSNLYFTNGRARAALSAGTGITYNNTTGVITNAAPDQVVALTASTAIAVTGTYPNFTIENTAPDQVVALTASTGISVTGTYPNFTITNTAPSSGGTITGGGTTNYLSKWTGASALGDSLVYDNGTNVGIGTSTPNSKLDVRGVIEGGDGTIRTVVSYTGSGGVTGTITNHPYILYANNDERMRITAAGNVGIGTTSPTAKLHVEGDGGTGLGNTDIVSLFKRTTTNGNSYIGIDTTTADRDSGIRFGDGGTNRWTLLSYRSAATDGFALYNHTANNFSMFIDNSSNVGIGTTAPVYRLHVKDSTNVGTIAIGHDTYPGLIYSNAGTGEFRIDNRSSAGVGYITFYPNGQAATIGSEAMRITTSGNVGIGTTAPVSKLQINHSAEPSFNPNGGSNALTLIKTTGSGAPGTFGAGLVFSQPYLTNDAAIGVGGIYGVKSVGDGAFGGGVAFFYQPPGDVSMAEAFRYNSSGNVGIGTTSPGTKLDVAGVTRSGAFLTNDATTTSIPIDTGGSKAYFNATNINGPALTLQSDSVGRTLRMYDGVNTVGAIDTNTGGLYIATNSSHPISFAPNASEAMRIAVGGNVGIGTTNSGYGKLGVYDASNSLIGIANSTSYAQFQQNGADLYINVNLSGTAGVGSLVFRRGASSTESMRIDPSGNVGIGTTAPQNLLHVYGGRLVLDHSLPNQSAIQFNQGGTEMGVLYRPGGISNQLRLFMSGAGDVMTWNSSGNVGIGTTAPKSKLQIVGPTLTINNENTYAVWVSDSGDDTKGLLLGYDLTNDVGVIQAVDQATAWKNISIASNGGNVSIGTTTNSGARTNIFLSESGSAPNAILRLQNTGAAYQAKMIITDGTTNDAVIGYQGGYTSATQYLGFGVGTAFTQMILTAAGNVGIGTTAPVAQLQVASATNAVDVLRIGNTAGDSGSVQGVTHLAINHFNAGTNPSTRITAYQDGVSGWPGGMYFSTRSLNTDSAPVERMRITSAGNVGIGTTAPSNILHITDVMRMDNVVGSAPQVTSYTPRNGYGDVETERCLAEPAVWLKINVDGTEYVIPAYTQA